MLFIQRAEGNVLDIRYIIDVAGLRGMLALHQAGRAQGHLSCSGDHQADGKLRNGHAVASRRIGKLKSCIRDRVIIHSRRCSLGNSEEFHSRIRPGFDGVCACVLIAQHNQLAAHALFPRHLLIDIALAVLQFAADGDVAVLFNKVQLILRDRCAKRHFLLFHDSFLLRCSLSYLNALSLSVFQIPSAVYRN